MALVILQLAVTSMLVGLCWTIQLVVYPQFANVIGHRATRAFLRDRVAVQ